MDKWDTTSVAIAGIIGAAAVAITVLFVIYNNQKLQVKAALYRECLATNEQIAAKAVEKHQLVSTISCSYF